MHAVLEQRGDNQRHCLGHVLDRRRVGGDVPRRDCRDSRAGQQHVLDSPSVDHWHDERQRGLLAGQRNPHQQPHRHYCRVRVRLPLSAESLSSVCGAHKVGSLLLGWCCHPWLLESDTLALLTPDAHNHTLPMTHPALVNRHLATPLAVIRFGRSWWFAGKYTLVGFEIAVLAASILVLRGGARAVPRGAEVAMFATSALMGVAAFVWFYVAAGEIQDDGFNDATQAEASSGECLLCSASCVCV